MTKNSSRGFTLIEVLVAVMILLLLAAPISKIYHQGAINTKARGRSTQALYLAVQIMEEIIAGGRYYPMSGESLHIQGYNYELSTTPKDGMILVTVKVFHESWDRDREVSLSTLIPEAD
ncbi:MAG: type II secretion system protein [Clostridia bacterium]|nr:type II secretion system protein [Clostridia bacterium]